MKNLYHAEVRTELFEYKDIKPELITAESILMLPEPIKKYIRSCGYIGKHQTLNGEM